MSYNVVTLVYSRCIGSAHRKAILAYMADRASEDGRGVFCSKGTIADETEIARSTVFKTIRDLVKEGILVEAGRRRCKNGSTVIYNLDLFEIRARPTMKGEPNLSDSRPPNSLSAGPVRAVTSPPAGLHQSGNRTPTSPATGPKPSLEPPLNKAAADSASTREPEQDLISEILHALGFDRGQSIPRYWIGSDAPLIVNRWVTDLGLTHVEVVHVAKQNAVQFGQPANGPKTLNRHMADFAAAKAAPTLRPTERALPIAPPQHPSLSPEDLTAMVRNHKAKQEAERAKR